MTTDGLPEVLPSPLVPAEVDLNGYSFMPVLHHRVLQSTLFVKSSGDEFKAAFALWCASWSEVPAGSLPNDEEMLEALSRSKAWKKVRARAMHNWVLCADGRLYHPVLAPLAIDAWERREEFREVKENRETRQQRWRQKVADLSTQLREIGLTPPKNASLEKLETMLRDALASTQASRVDGARDTAETSLRDTSEMALTGTETGTETREEIQRRAHQDSDEVARDPPTPLAAARLALKRGGIHPATYNPEDQVLVELVRQGATPDEFEALAREAIRKGIGKPLPWVTATLIGRRADAAAVHLAPAVAAAPPTRAEQRAETIAGLTTPPPQRTTHAEPDFVDVAARVIR